jgi:hypothetical protein
MLRMHPSPFRVLAARFVVGFTFDSRRRELERERSTAHCKV